MTFDKLVIFNNHHLNRQPGLEGNGMEGRGLCRIRSTDKQLVATLEQGNQTTAANQLIIHQALG
jgi:hypothetical protein